MSDIKELDPIYPGDINIETIDDYEKNTIDTIAQIDDAIDDLSENINNLRRYFDNNKMRFISSEQPDTQKDGAAWFIVT